MPIIEPRKPSPGEILESARKTKYGISRAKKSYDAKQKQRAKAERKARSIMGQVNKRFDERVARQLRTWL